MKLLARLHYNTNTVSDAPDVRQSPPESPNYAQGGPISHAAYDPVHDAYDLPRVEPNQAGDYQGTYTTDVYHRGDRSVPHAYESPRRYENTTLAPIQPLHHHGHLPHSSVHTSETSMYRTSARTHSPGHSLHSFQVHSQAQPASSSSSTLPHGATHPARGEGESAPYPSLPPLSIPAQASSSSGEGKGGSKRIVMACHQCRGRKIRCDAVRPACSNCVRRREECRYDAKPKRRGPDKVPGSRMRSCKSRKQTAEETSPSGTFRFCRHRCSFQAQHRCRL
ncbi:uncharacterized protein FOMMEDRAFT_162241 [Fomitiporia mediterranea MF3/22]|uniref:uncharacterized protein n=1 Tax=Fomitiporia mediterranea (strain MF3/22) TaxID=694068 RepID=UPI00044079C3|nr:uncharacterized protein FOMMEDRAFT_162241 [Fomitiporia mediterranea MF3/22]EJC97900.1 hypothetical protein FOMMEDRAFT_162241 [Fomitiporia mediterranea MF3/22]